MSVDIFGPLALACIAALRTNPPLPESSPAEELDALAFPFHVRMLASARKGFDDVTDLIVLDSNQWCARRSTPPHRPAPWFAVARVQPLSPVVRHRDPMPSVTSRHPLGRRQAMVIQARGTPAAANRARPNTRPRTPNCPHNHARAADAAARW
ncbi:hypothetical protein [Streptomyces sp. NPDC001970]